MASPRTRHLYRRTVERLAAQVGGGKPVQLSDLSESAVNEYLLGRMQQKVIDNDHPLHPLTDRALSPHSVHQEVRTLRTFGRWLARNSYPNPFEKLTPRKLPKLLNETD